MDELERALMPGVGPKWLAYLQSSIFSGMQFSKRRAGAAVRDVYVPTGCHLLLSQLCRTFPEHHLTVADFSHWGPESAATNSHSVSEAGFSLHKILFYFKDLL